MFIVVQILEGQPDAYVWREGWKGPYNREVSAFKCPRTRRDIHQAVDLMIPDDYLPAEEKELPTPSPQLVERAAA